MDGPAGAAQGPQDDEGPAHGTRSEDERCSVGESKGGNQVKRDQVNAILAKSSDPNAGVLLRLRQGDSATIHAQRQALRAAFGPCPDGCSLWECGRQAGHAGPCYPPERVQ